MGAIHHITPEQQGAGEGGGGGEEGRGEAFLKRKCHCFEPDSVTAEHLARR
jgi:hypothetical protein